MAQSPTIIAAGTTVSGRIEGSEDLQVLGAVKGTVQLEGALLIDEAARVEADCTVTHLEVHGVLVGDVTAADTIEIHKTARIIGDLRAPRVIMHEGALFRGLLDMGDLDSEASASRRATSRSPARASRSRPAPRRAASEPVAEATPAPEPAPKVVKKKVTKKAAQ
jgi:cytoskeletal protein CcmA (bactofilin family)